MLLSSRRARLTRALLLLALVAERPAGAQAPLATERAPAAVADGSAWTARGAPVLSRPDAVLPTLAGRCAPMARCLAEMPNVVPPQEPASGASGRRRTYALVGLVVGAAVGWGWFRHRCNTGSECFSPFEGVLLAGAGGAVGLVVGLLIAPSPQPARDARRR